MENQIENTNKNSESTKDEESRKIYNDAKSKLEALKKKKNSVSIKLLILLTGLISGTVIYASLYSIYNQAYVIAIALFTAVLAMLILYTYFVFLVEAKSIKYNRLALEYEANNIKEKIVKETKNDVFENSLGMSYKYLDQYYLQVRDHAQKGFFVTISVSILGAILVALGIILMFLDKTNPSYITSAAGIITEFISTIFFYLYNKTLQSMSNYHDKLIISQNISIALKLTESMPDDEQVEVKKTIIKELIANVNSYLIKDKE